MSATQTATGVSTAYVAGLRAHADRIAAHASTLTERALIEGALDQARDSLAQMRAEIDAYRQQADWHDRHNLVAYPASPAWTD